MHNVAVSAWATSTFTKGSKMSLFELACEPSVQLIRESGISAKEIDAVLFSSCAIQALMLWLLLLQLLRRAYVILYSWLEQKRQTALVTSWYGTSVEGLLCFQYTGPQYLRKPI